MERRDPYRNFNFRLEVDGVAVAHFSEMTTGERVAKPANRDKLRERKPVRKLPGLTKYGTITLKRGVIGHEHFSNWLGERHGDSIGDRSPTVAIALLDESGEETERWIVSCAWPVKYDPSDLNASGNEVLIDLLELANEGIDRVR